MTPENVVQNLIVKLEEHFRLPVFMSFDGEKKEVRFIFQGLMDFVSRSVSECTEENMDSLYENLANEFERLMVRRMIEEKVDAEESVFSRFEVDIEDLFEELLDELFDCLPEEVLIEPWPELSEPHVSIKMHLNEEDFEETTEILKLCFNVTTKEWYVDGFAGTEGHVHGVRHIIRSEEDFIFVFEDAVGKALEEKEFHEEVAPQLVMERLVRVLHQKEFSWGDKAMFCTPYFMLDQPEKMLKFMAEIAPTVEDGIYRLGSMRLDSDVDVKKMCKKKHILVDRDSKFIHDALDLPSVSWGARGIIMFVMIHKVRPTVAVIEEFSMESGEELKAMIDEVQALGWNLK